MKAVIQRVTSASVTVDGEITGEIGKGLVILLGVSDGDTEAECDTLVSKISQMRIFEDESGKMNLSCKDIGGAALVVSNFTLCADCRRGNRPDFFDAMRPEGAKALYESFKEKLGASFPVKSGIFGAEMKLHLLNDGPVTIILDTETLKKPRKA